MNIPDEGFFTLLTQGMRNRTVETLQRALYHTLRDAILQGTLTARCRLPGSRVMAERLHLSRNTVNAALEQLALEGYLTRSRQGTQVAPLASCRQEAGQMPPVVLPERLQRLPAAMRRDSPTLAFTPGMPAVNYFPLPLWRRLMDNVLREDGSALLGYGEAAGDPLLREAIARHLALSRGIRCDIRQIVITEGALEGVNLCASLLTNPGDSVWLEEPGYLGARSGFQRAGLRVCGMAVDGEGMCIDNGVAEPPRLIFTSPSHQYPLGSVMSAARRLALVEYAHRHGAWIVEDDYDSEFRFSGQPIPALQGLAPEAPVVVGSPFVTSAVAPLRACTIAIDDPGALTQYVDGHGAAFLRGSYYLPQILPIAVAGFMWSWILDTDGGALNAVLTAIGVASPPDWLGSADVAIYGIMLMLIWLQLGYPVVIFMAALGRVDPSIYEAADVDGASWWSQFTRITLPELKPEIFIVTLTALVGALKVFAPILILTGGGPEGSTVVPSYYAYRNFFELSRVGYGAAISNVMALLILVIAIGMLVFQRRATDD